MDNNYEITGLIVLCSGAFIAVIALYCVWHNRSAAFTAFDGPRIIRTHWGDFAALGAVLLPTLLHLSLHGWEADFSTPFSWDLYAMWGGWLSGLVFLAWNHWDDPEYWKPRRYLRLR